jgi:hypothetical protein
MNIWRRFFHYATDGKFLRTKNIDKYMFSNESLRQKTETDNIYKLWMQTTERFADINNLYQEIIFLRNAVQMIFTEGQWAALELVGRRMHVLKSSLRKIKLKEALNV